MHELNLQQRQAVEHKDGPLLVIAGAGTGKTRVITERIAQIVNSKWCRHDEVLALTFTEKATAEIEERVDRLMPLGYESIPIHTFHSFCDQILRSYGIDIGLSPGYRILQGVEHWLFVKEHLFEFDLDYYRPLGNPTSFIDALVSIFGRFKEELNSPEHVDKIATEKLASAQSDEEKLEGKRLHELATAYAQYQELLAENSLLDFADLHYKVIELFKKRPNILAHLQKRYHYILVDEYQDTNIAQNTIVEQLAGKAQNIMAVGDDDQSIYKFRGAAISNILQFEERYPHLKKIVLTENYRSNQKILDFAYQSIQNNNPDRLEVKSGVNKRLTSDRPGAEESIRLVHSTDIEQEVDYAINVILRQAQDDKRIPLSEIAILARTNAQLHAFTEALKKRGIPYDFVSEKGLYHKEEIRDVISFLRVLANPTDDLSLYRILRMPLWNVSMETITTLMQAAQKKYQSVSQQIKSNDDCKFLADTLHDCREFSRNHTVGETLYRFTETVKLYEQLLQKGTIEAEEQIINIATFFNKIRQFERDNKENTVLDFVAYLDLAEEAGENPSAKFEVEEREGVFVSTVHGAKGLEFHTVFLASLTNDRFPSINRKNPIDMPNELVHEILSGDDTHIQEERRLFYVAVTRAKENLHLLYSDSYTQSFSKNPRKKKRSRFIDEVIEKIPLNIIETAPLPVIPAPPSVIPESTSGISRTQTLVSRHNPIAFGGDSPLQGNDMGKNGSDRGRTQFSYSQLLTFQSCPRQYEYQYILKIPQPTNANFSFGYTMHTTLQEFYKRVMQTKQASLFTEFQPDISLESLLKIYDEKWVDQGYESRAHRDARRVRGREILTKFHSHFNEGIPQVRFLEKGFKLKIGNYTLSGRIDRADDLPDGTLEIIDYKTGKTRSEKEVETDLQLFIYALAAQECFGIPASRLTLYFLDDDVKISTVPDAKKFEKIKTEVVEIADQINRSDFAPTPDKWKCKHCPFNRICDASMA